MDQVGPVLYILINCLVSYTDPVVGNRQLNIYELLVRFEVLHLISNMVMTDELFHDYLFSILFLSVPVALFSCSIEN